MNCEEKISRAPAVVPDCVGESSPSQSVKSGWADEVLISLRCCRFGSGRASVLIWRGVPCRVPGVNFASGHQLCTVVPVGMKRLLYASEG